MLRLVLVALGCAGVVAVPVYTATLGDKPPAVTGPLAEQTNNRWCASSPGTSGSACVFDYLLDPKTTTDPGDSWHAYWGSSETTASAKRGFCTTEVGLYLYWGPKGATRTYPPLGATAARPGAVARLTVDAAGHATVPASLQQKTSWPQGIVTATPKRGGGLVVDWQGRTTRGVSLISAAEVEHPAAAAGAYIITQPVEIGAPCAGLPPPGPGFLARVVPASAPGRTAWLQVRIPGTGVRWSGGGFASGGGLATITFGSGSPYTIGVTGRSAVPITRGRNGFLPGRLVVRVRLHGPTGTRNYRLSVHVH